MDLGDPITVGLLAADAFERRGLPYAICGGMLVAIYGEPRETRDADLAVAEVAAADARAALAAVGLSTTISFEDLPLGGFLVDRLSNVMGEAHLGLNTIDLVRPRSARYRAEALRRAVRGELRGVGVNVLTAEDFVIFKTLASRDRDVEDAAWVIRRLGPSLDRSLIESEVEMLARELPDLDVPARWKGVVERAARLL